MLISDGKYLKPSKDTRVLAILNSLAENSGQSQYELGRRLNLSGAMINQYLRQLKREQLVEYLPVNGKSYKYVLTEDGETSRRRMFSDYSSETIRLYTTVKSYILEKLRPLEDEGFIRLALFGASETCEVVMSAIRGTGFKVLVLVDNDPAKHGLVVGGHPVTAPGVLRQLQVDAVVITSFGRQDEIHRQIKPLADSRGFKVVRI